MTCHMCGNEHSVGEYCSDECANEAVRISEFNALSFNNIKNGFQIIHGSETWVDPKVITKEKQKQKVIDLEQSLMTFDNICSIRSQTSTNHSWGMDPAQVIVQLLAKAFPFGDGYGITYNDASRIMEQAKTPKMVGGVNRGIDEIKQNWKQNYVGEI